MLFSASVKGWTVKALGENFRACRKRNSCLTCLEGLGGTPKGPLRDVRRKEGRVWGYMRCVQRMGGGVMVVLVSGFFRVGRGLPAWRKQFSSGT